MKHLTKASKILFLILIITSCSSKVPQITSIDPKIGRMGEVVTLTGINFGEERGESYITVAGIAPTNSSYYIWQNDQIMFRIPELGESGLIYVFVKGKKSNGVLFANSTSVPRPIEGDAGFEPIISSVNPQTGSPGSVIVISGSNFGNNRNGPQSNSGVFFSWDYTAMVNPNVVKEPDYIEVSQAELGYESWTAREIRARVPDGAVSGNLEVRTHNGRSRPIFFDISGKPGIKNFTDKRSYTVRYSVDIKVQEATWPNSLYLWIPVPATTPSQRKVTLVSQSREPFDKNINGINIFKLENLLSESSHTVILSYQVDVYAIETAIRTLSVGKEITPLSIEYTQASTLVPSNNAQVISTVNSIIDKEQNQYLKAKLIYDWITTNITITEPTNAVANIPLAIHQKRADPYTAALLYSALMRAAGIPCVPVAGVLIDRNRQTIRHYWTEFWIDGFGWLPVDPALGSGAIPPTFSAKEDFVNYYFGNMDNQHIAFSWGEHNLTRVERGRWVSRAQSYSMQNIWEEATGGLESYTSLWTDISITGIYVH